MAILGDTTVFQFMRFSTVKVEIFGVMAMKPATTSVLEMASSSSRTLPSEQLATFNHRGIREEVRNTR